MRASLIFLLLSLGACGQKGQLYLPGTEDPAVAVPAAETPAPGQADEESSLAEQDANKQKKD